MCAEKLAEQDNRQQHELGGMKVRKTIFEIIQLNQEIQRHPRKSQPRQNGPQKDPICMKHYTSTPVFTPGKQ